MRDSLQQMPDTAQFGRFGAPFQSHALVPRSPRMHVESWGKPWPRANIPIMSDDDGPLLQQLALAHLIVGVCGTFGLAWHMWIVSGPTLSPAIGMVISVGGALALLFCRMDRPELLTWARLALVAVDLGAPGDILWVRGGEGWPLLLLFPAIALAIAFFAERGGALATMLAALVIVAMNGARNVPLSRWMPSFLVFLGVATLLVAVLSVYRAWLRETSESLRWLLSDAHLTNKRLQTDRHNLLTKLHAAEQAQEPLLHERARFADAATELATLAQGMAQGDPSAVRILQTLRPGAYGPLAGVASALARLSRLPANSWGPTAIPALDTSVRAQGEALESLDTMARALSVGANELVMEALALESGIGPGGSGQYPRALWQLEHHLRAQAAEMALLGTQLADIRTAQENLETVLARATAGATSSSIFAASDVLAASLSSAPQVEALGASAVRRAAVSHPGGHGTVRGASGKIVSPWRIMGESDIY